MTYKASNALERFIKDAAPLHYATADAPETYEELRGYYDTLVLGDPIPVQSAGCDNTIYSSPEVNHAWRAYHDGIHIVRELDFSRDDELEACEVQLDHMRAYHEHYGFTDEDYQAVIADVAGQRLYYSKHGEYVKDQARFVQRCLDVGMLNAIEEKQ